MSLSDLASLGSFASGVTVAVTLIFTLIQLRQNNRNLRAVMQQTRTGRYTEQIMRPTEPFLCEATTRAMEGEVELSSMQAAAFARFVANVLWNSEDVFLQYRSGNLDREAFESDTGILKAFLAIPAFRVGWRMNRDFSNGVFREYVDELMRETKAARFPKYADWYRSLMTEELAAIA